MKTRLSVNLNKVALIRNARGGGLPNLAQVAIDCQDFGAQGITVHPRPDERHVRFDDLAVLRKVVHTEFNIEGYPSNRFMEAVLSVKPDQCTLVPDPPGVLTSSEGWNTIRHKDLLTEVCSALKSEGIRVSLFMDPIADFIHGAKNVNADRIELYTGDYAQAHKIGQDETLLSSHKKAALLAKDLGLGVNAGHDLNLSNLSKYKRHLPELMEVSIGHALISDALYYGLKNTILLYLKELTSSN